MLAQMWVKVGSWVAPTIGKAHMSVPISYGIGFVGPWALGPGPPSASIGESCSIFFPLQELPPLQEKGRAQERLRT
eukprot:1508033-Karenia_brevis.AAC.1